MGLPNLTDSGQNPADIASQIALAVEAESNTIGGLKQSAQDDHDHIEGLRTSAQSDHDAIQALFSNTNAEQYHMATGFSNGFTAYSWRSGENFDEGVRIRRIGALYLIDIAVVKGQGTGYYYDVTIMNVGSNITKPTNTVYLGNHYYGYGSSEDVFFTPMLTASGDLQVSGYSGDGTHTVIFASFIGIDIA